MLRATGELKVRVFMWDSLVIENILSFLEGVLWNADPTLGSH